VIENIGIAPESGTATFYVNDEKSEFSSFEPAIAGRNGMKTHPVTVQAVTFGQLLAKHGVPYYLKVDIERADGLCGPFGEETPGEWQTLEDVAYNWIHLNKGYSKRGTLNRRSWHDFHAKRD
jgi:hypothetical protein